MNFLGTTKKYRGDALESRLLKASPLYFFVVPFLFFSFQPTVAHAQVAIGAPPAPVQYTVSREVPGPNEPVIISVAGVGDFLGNSKITWTLNGSVAKEGTGETRFSFTTGAIGKQTIVKVIIASTEHGAITKTWIFNPSLVNLVWEARTTVPPLYRGKALYSAGSTITVYAFPQVIAGGKRVSDAVLSFQWSLDDQPQPSKSGRGRNTFVLQGDQLHTSETVSVTILSGGVSVAESDISIGATDPALVLYARDPLRGVLYETALPGTLQMSGPELTLHAESYFFSRSLTQSGALSWLWTLNGTQTTGPNADRGELTLRTQGGSGSATVGVSLQSTGAATFLQAAKSAITLRFGSQQNNPAFGI